MRIRGLSRSLKGFASQKVVSSPVLKDFQSANFFVTFYSPLFYVFVLLSLVIF